MFFLLLAFGECWLSYLFAARVSEIPAGLYRDPRNLLPRKRERTHLHQAGGGGNGGGPAGLAATDIFYHSLGSL